MKLTEVESRWTARLTRFSRACVSAVAYSEPVRWSVAHVEIRFRGVDQRLVVQTNAVHENISTANMNGTAN